MALSYSFNEELWMYPGNGAWYFITLPFKYSEEIKTVAESSKRGFGSVKIKAKIGLDSWDTSIFPDTKSKSYLLPVKKEIRKNNNLQAGEKVKVSISIVDS